VVEWIPGRQRRCVSRGWGAGLRQTAFFDRLTATLISATPCGHQPRTMPCHGGAAEAVAACTYRHRQWIWIVVALECFVFVCGQQARGRGRSNEDAASLAQTGGDYSQMTHLFDGYAQLVKARFKVGAMRVLRRRRVVRLSSVAQEVRVRVWVCVLSQHELLPCIVGMGDGGGFLGARKAGATPTSWRSAIKAALWRHG
jgi:hypothetical protein